jgi:hypothetical protein
MIEGQNGQFNPFWPSIISAISMRDPPSQIQNKIKLY